MRGSTQRATEKVRRRARLEPIDAGAFSIDPPMTIRTLIVPAVRAAVATGERAVVFGGSGLGECIAGQ